MCSSSSSSPSPRCLSLCPCHPSPPSPLHGSHPWWSSLQCFTVSGAKHLSVLSCNTWVLSTCGNHCVPHHRPFHQTLRELLWWSLHFFLLQGGDGTSPAYSPIQCCVPGHVPTLVRPEPGHAQPAPVWVAGVHHPRASQNSRDVHVLAAALVVVHHLAHVQTVLIRA